MNLNRAKTVLIVCFLLLNVFLGFQLQQRVKGSEQAESQDSEQLQQLTIELEKRGIDLNAQLPTAINTAAILSVSPPVPTLDLASDLVGEKLIPEVLPEGIYRLEGSKGRATVYQNGSLIFIPERKSTGITLTKEEAQKMVKQFLTDTNILPADNFLLSNKLTENDKYKFIYHQSFLNVKIYSSILEITVGPRGIENVYFFWLQPRGFREEEQQLLKPAEALLRFLDYTDEFPAGICIESVNYGYYSRPYEAQKWELPPVWRLQFSTGEIVYINAYTGQLEQYTERVEQH